MTNRPLLLIIPIMLLLFGTVTAIDVNASDETELNAYIAQLIAEQQSNMPQQPVVVQIKSDESLNQKIELIISQLGELKATDDRMQEKFTTLVVDFDTKLAGTEERVAARQEAKLTEVTDEQTEAMKAYIREQTNPVRMNLPSIGVFLMATALFLILISRTYNFKGKEINLVSKKQESESKKEFNSVLEKAKEEKAKEDMEEKKKKEKEEKEEKKKELQRLVEAQEAIKKQIEAVKNG